jgi:hypothetical protein
MSLHSKELSKNVTDRGLMYRYFVERKDRPFSFRRRREAGVKQIDC